MCIRKKNKTALADAADFRQATAVQTGTYRRPKVNDDIIKSHGSVPVTPPADFFRLTPVVDPAAMQPYEIAASEYKEEE